MEIRPEDMRKFGLIGKDIEYSFSRTYFTKKFEENKIAASYVNFDCSTIDQVQTVLQDKTISGYNVTIPYKIDVLPLLDEIHPQAQTIGAINTIKRSAQGRLIGYNTDFLGFACALLETLGLTYNLSSMIDELPPKALQGCSALILGTGGASMAVTYALDQMGARYTMVSRKRSSKTIRYDALTTAIIQSYDLIINTTPLGTFPNISQAPVIPYIALKKGQTLFDLIYNPAETRFLKAGKLSGAKTTNGLHMLQLQADFAWDIWNNS